MSGTVLGIYTSLTDAEKTLTALKQMGYASDQVGILARGLEDTQMQIPAGNDTTYLGMAGGSYPDYGLQEPDVFNDIQDTLSAGSMTSPEHAQSTYVEQGVNSHETESTDDNTTSYAVGGYFTAATSRGEPFNPTYQGYTGVRNQSGTIGDYDDGKPWSSYSGHQNKNAETYNTTVRYNNEAMPAFRNTGRPGFGGRVNDGKEWSNYGGVKAGQLTQNIDATNKIYDEFVLTVRVDSNSEINDVIGAMTQRGAIDTETFINES